MRRRFVLVCGGLVVLMLPFLIALAIGLGWVRLEGAGAGDRVSGIGGIIDQQAALAMALRETPLRDLRSAERTRQLPIRHVFTGTDAAGKELVVWVRASVERYEYLDQYIAKQQAVAIAARNGAPANAPAVLNYLGYRDQPVFWDVGGVYIHAATGGLMRWTGTEVIIAPAD